MAGWITSPTGPMTTHFWGPVANWGLGLSGAYDAMNFGPEMINERMSATQVVYSALFMRFAWQVQPRNYILFACHGFNVSAQSNQVRRWGQHVMDVDKEKGPARIQELSMMGGGALAGIGAILLARRPLQAALTSSGSPGFVQKIAKYDAGPFYIHFWAPNFKWALSINNFLDFDRPVEKVSLSMNSALVTTGLLFCRWSFVITPVNYSLFFVNFALWTSSGYHLARKVKHDYM